VDNRNKERLAGNEAVFRDVNEAIESGRIPAEVHETVAFRCECGELGCNDLIELTVGDYERVRAHPRRFLVTIGHQRDEIETIVETHPGYAVVEKRDQAGQLAEESDPRS
jgi:hypothetical protein